MVDYINEKKLRYARHKINLGAHMSIQGGVHKALERGRATGCRVVQIFTQNQMQWKSSPLDTQSAILFRKLSTRFYSIFAHSSYLINLGSPDSTLFRKSVDKLADEIDRCHSLGLKQLVIHPGYHCGNGMKNGIMRVAEGIREVIGSAQKLGVMIVLETTAGQGTAIGYRLEQLNEVLHAAGITTPKSIGICIDTCHLFAAGYDFSTPDLYESFVGEFDRIIGLQWLKIIHLNDSKGVCGSRVDRHEHIGCGHIGINGFRSLLNDTRLSPIPMCIETPKGQQGSARGTSRDTPKVAVSSADVKNLAVLTSLAETF